MQNGGRGTAARTVLYGTTAARSRRAEERPRGKPRSCVRLITRRRRGDRSRRAAPTETVILAFLPAPCTAEPWSERESDGSSVPSGGTRHLPRSNSLVRSGRRQKPRRPLRRRVRAPVGSSPSPNSSNSFFIRSWRMFTRAVL